MLITAIPANDLQAAAIHTVRRTQYNRLSQQQLTFLFVYADALEVCYENAL